MSAADSPVATAITHIAIGGANGIMRQNDRWQRVNMTCGASLVINDDQITIQEECCSCCTCCPAGCDCNDATQTFSASSIIDASESWAFRDKQSGMIWAPCTGRVVTVLVHDEETGKRLHIGIATSDPAAIMSLLARAAGKESKDDAGDAESDSLPIAPSVAAPASDGTAMQGPTAGIVPSAASGAAKGPVAFEL